jgi:hypothetical protein
MKVLMTIVIGIALGAALSLLFAWATAALVNYLFAAAFLTFVFGTAKITFWQAFVLNLLTGLLFRSSSSSSKD